MSFVRLDGVGSVLDDYDGFILDIWGVLYDGVAVPGEAISALARLRSAGKRVALLSNAPRRAETVAQGLAALGIPRDLYGAVMTSGEAVWQGLRARSHPAFTPFAGVAWHVGAPADRDLLHGLAIPVAAAPDAADFVLNTGADDARGSSDATAYAEELRACAAAALPMLCANPDLGVLRGGAWMICAGTLAAHYEEIGGTVTRIGKPDPTIYDTVLNLLGVRRDRALVIGDGLATDIAGAAAAAVDACWILHGMNADPTGRALNEHEARSRAADRGLSPRFVMEALRP